MRSGVRRYCTLAATLMVLFLCWGLALSEAAFLENEYRHVSARLQGEGVNNAWLTKALFAPGEGAPQKLSAWARSGSTVTLENADIGAAVKARTVAVFGDMGDVCPMRVLYGAIPSSADEKGCVIDEETAMGLYRGTDVVGARLSFGGNNYIVRAVVAAIEPMVLFRSENASYDTLALSFPDLERAAAGAADFLQRFDFAGEYVLVENGFFGSLLADLAVLPCWIVFFSILLMPLKAAWKRRNVFLQLFVLSLVAAALYIVLKWLFGITFDWPARFLPGMWSDFDFWPALLGELRAYAKSLAFLAPTSSQIYWNAAVGKLLLSVFIASAAMMRFLRLHGRYAQNGLFDVCALLCIVLSMLASTGILYLIGSSFAPTRGFLFAAPACWLAKNCSSYTRARMAAKRPIVLY